MGLFFGLSDEECDSRCDKEIRNYEKSEENCRFDKKELRNDIEKYKERWTEAHEKIQELESESKKCQSNVVSELQNQKVQIAQKVQPCHDSCGACSGPGHLDCISCRDGSDIIDKDGSGSGACKSTVISLTGDNTGFLRKITESFQNTGNNDNDNDNDIYMLILLIIIVSILYICK